MENDWISGAEAAAILELTHFACLRLGKEGVLNGRRVRVPGARGPLQWEFLRTEIEARREAMLCSREASGLGDEWIDIGEARRILKVQRATIYHWVQAGFLQHRGIGPKGKRRSYFLRAECEKLGEAPPEWVRDVELPRVTASPEQCAWLAGFFDGEGCVQIHARPSGIHYAEIVVGNTCLPALEAIRHTFGGSVAVRCASATHKRRQWTWKAASDLGYCILKAIRPYLKVKHLQADLAIEFQERIRRVHHNAAYRLSDEEKVWRARQRFYVRCLNNPKNLPIIP